MYKISHSLVLLALVLLPAYSFADDCNDNLTNDLEDIELLRSVDCNGNHIPDECEVIALEPSFNESGPVLEDSFPSSTTSVNMRSLSGDLNGDGEVDILTVIPPILGTENTEISVSISQSTEGEVIYTGIGDAKEIVAFRVVDLDGDSKEEGIFVDSEKISRLSYNDGSPQLTNIHTINSAEISAIHDIVTSDFDSINGVDFAYLATHSTNGLVVVVGLNDGTGNTFSTSTSLVGVQPGSGAVAFGIGDIDGDSKEDIGVLHEADSDSLTALINNGAGIFSKQTFSIPGDFQSGPSAFADLDLDGDVDVIYQNTDLVLGEQRTSVAMNTGTRFVATASAPKDFVGLADLNEDNTLDLIFLNNAREGLVLYNDSELSFSNRSAFPIASVDTNCSATQKLVVQEIADFNDDSKPDFLVTRLGSERIACGAGIRPFDRLNTILNTSSPRSEEDFCKVVRATEGDYQGIGRANYVVARAQNAGWHWYISSGGEDSSPSSHAFGLSDFDRLQAGDYNGSGVFSPGVVRSWAGGLDWYYRLTNDRAVRTQWGLVGDIPLTGYFDKDPSMDLAVVRSAGTNYVWYLRNSRGDAPSPIIWGVTGGTDTPFTGDVTGDGIDELIIARKVNGGITWYPLQLGSNGSPHTPLAIIQWGLIGDEMMSPFDYSGDGIEDLVVVREVNGGKVAFVRFSGSDQFKVINFGLVGDIPFFGVMPPGASNFVEFGVFRPTPSQGSVLARHYVLNRYLSGNFELSFESLFSYGFSTDTLVRPDGKGVTSFSGRNF